MLRKPIWPSQGVGDWAIYNGTAWGKVDNSDMRTRINELEARLQKLGLLGRFAAGPRQSTSLDGSFAGGGRILNYGAVRSLVQDFEKNTEGESGGFGLRYTAPTTGFLLPQSGVPAWDEFVISVNDLVSFSYDALGRRITKTVYPPIPLAPETTTSLHVQRLGGNILIQGGSDIVEERVMGVVVKSFVLDATRSSDDEVVKSWTWRQTSGPFLMRTGGQDYYLHKDDLGNVLALTDGVTNVVERYAYDDYGEPTFLTSDGLPLGTNTSPVGNPYLFHGMTWDGETRLYQAIRDTTGPFDPTKWGRHSQGATTGPFDPKTAEFVNGRYVMRAGVPVRFSSGRGFAGNNPWSLKKEEGGRHTPFHNKYRPQLSARGDEPTQAQFGSLIDSMVNLVDDREFLDLRVGKGSVKFFNQTKGFGFPRGSGRLLEAIQDESKGFSSLIR